MRIPPCKKYTRSLLGERRTGEAGGERSGKGVAPEMVVANPHRGDTMRRDSASFPLEKPIMNLTAVLAALHLNPADDLGWLAIADCLEEQGEIERAELARLSAQARAMKAGVKRRQLENRVRELLAAGVKPCVPTITNS